MTTYYVAKNGNDGWDGSEPTPWLTIRYGCDQLSAEDILYVKGDGISIVEYEESAAGRDYEHPCCYPSNSGSDGSPITIAAYPGHERLVRIIAPGTNGASPIGSYGSDWIVWSGFRLKSNSTNYRNGGAWFGGGANYFTIKNNIFEGVTNITVADNREGLRIDACNDFLVENNLFENWWSDAQNWMSNAAIRTYGINGGVFQNNVFDDCNCGIDFKGDANVDDVKTTYVRYNIFRNFTSQSDDASNVGIHGFHQVSPSGSNGARHIDIYQNVFDTLTSGISDGEGGCTDWNIYNNTFYNVGQAHEYWWVTTYTEWNLWNNIYDTTSSYLHNGRGTSAPGAFILYSEYNCFYDYPANFTRWDYTNRNLTWWRGEGYDDVGKSITPGSSPLSDPGNDDYRLSSYDVGNPCYGTGRGGDYEDNMGAYVIGSETIGTDFNGDSSSSSSESSSSSSESSSSSSESSSSSSSSESSSSSSESSSSSSELSSSSSSESSSSSSSESSSSSSESSSSSSESSSSSSSESSSSSSSESSSSSSESSSSSSESSSSSSSESSSSSSSESSSSSSSESSSSSSSSESSSSSSSSESSSSSSESSSSSSESSSSSSITPGTACWGHDTGVVETYTLNFSGNWTGGIVGGAGDGETLTLTSGQNSESNVHNLGNGEAEILIDKYAAGSGPAPVIRYKTGNSPANCEADVWNIYDGVSFTSLGWVKIQLNRN